MPFPFENGLSCYVILRVEPRSICGQGESEVVEMTRQRWYHLEHAGCDCILSLSLAPAGERQKGMILDWAFLPKLAKSL